MRFSVLAILAVLGATASACKCGTNRVATEYCCRQAGGEYVPSAQDCKAGSMSERLSTFAGCCRRSGVRSDCRCPIGCTKEEQEQFEAEEKLYAAAPQ